VLEDAYGYTRTDIADALDKILRTSQFAFEDKDALWGALADYQRGKGDLADHLIGRLAHRAGCGYTLTFDRALKANRLFRLI
jgi:predicted nucleic-acid-binding protein